MTWRDPEPTPEQAEYVRTHQPVDGAVHPDRLDRFGWQEGDVEPMAPPQCAACGRLTSDRRWTCEAFPGGIPGSILGGQFDHTKPYLGDRGLRFLPRGDS